MLAMKQEISFFRYWCWRILMKALYYLFYIPLIIRSWGKGKTVPQVKNVLLLKSATELAADIRAGKLKSKEVLLAYIERIIEVEPYINSVVDHHFEDAIMQAKQVDNLIAAGEISKKRLEEEMPLLGIPFTVKMLLRVKGFRCSIGCALFEDSISSEDAPTVAQLKNAGGIPLAVTNAPAFGFSSETHNPLHGITCNPYDTNRTSGGSSGGESALLAAAGSVIGLGNDLAGSVRIPAHCCGIFAHKPSLGMVSNEGNVPNLNSKIRNAVYTGPMCRYAEDLITVMKVLTKENSRRISLDKPSNFKNLKIYYQLKNMDPKMEPMDVETQETILKAVNYFSENYGVTATAVNLKLLNISSFITQHILMDDVPNLVQEVTEKKINHWSFLTTLQEILKYCFGKSVFNITSIFYFTMARCPPLFRDRYVTLYRQKLEKLKDQFDSMLDQDSVFFYPCSPSAARRHFEMIPLMLNGCYTAIFNFLGLPVTQCPLGLNRDGLPHGMQIVGRMNNDSLTVACAVELSKALGGWIPPN